MKKGLFTFLKISVACLIVIAIVAFASHNFTSFDSGSDKTTSSNQALYNTSEPKESSSLAVSDSTPVDEAKDSQNSEADSEADSVDPQEQTVDEGSDEEPVLPEATPEPDMDPDTWDYIKGGDYNMLYKDKESEPDKMPYEIHVNKQMNCITVYEPGKKEKYTKAVRSMVCSAGSATPLGTFTTSSKYYWKAMIHGVWAQYATRITGNILFHSVPYDTHEKNTLIANYYNQLGGTASAGCVRLATADAKWVIENCPAGTTVVIYNSSDPGPLGKPKPVRIPYNCTWDPTDPDTRNPWNSKETTITGVENRTVERGSSVNYLEGVTAYDIFNNKMSTSSIKVSTKLDKAAPGEYNVKYSYKDSKGNTVKEKAVYTVVDTTAPKISGVPATYYTRDASKITEESIFNMVSLTDNGYSIDKKNYLTITLSGDTAVLTAHDDYTHSTVLNCKIIEDNESPEIKLEKELSEDLSIATNTDAKWASKRIKKVSDNAVSLTSKDVKISAKPSGWGMKITYSVSDKAGNSTTVSEKVKYETASVIIEDPNPVVYDIKDNDELESLIYVQSDVTNEDIDYKLKIKKEKLEGNEQCKTYKVTYTAVYKSSAGSSTASNSVVVSVPR